MMHKSVLLQEVVEGLEANSGEVILDGTVGNGGHSEALCKALHGKGTLVCLDQDEDALERSQKRLSECGCRLLFYQTNFRHLDLALDALGVSRVDRMVFDLGLSSNQLEESGRGFSFQKNEPLLMTFGREGKLTAREIVNEWDEENISAILWGYGEERQARRIAKAIVEAREKKPIATSAELADLVEGVVRRRGKIHPATKTFQALRVAVNDEWQSLREMLPKALERLNEGGRMAVISFQSMEDRAVKQFFRESAKNGKGRVITKKPITPSTTELLQNPRARSAKLRIFEKSTS